MTTCYRCEKCGMVFDDYVKYYYSAKKPAEQVFPVDESLMK